MDNFKFGRLEPTPEKISDNNRYSFNLLGFAVPDKIEKTIPYPKELVTYYDQKNMNACTGYSCSWMNTINNEIEYGKVTKYDAVWLYHQAQLTDGNPFTDPTKDNGAYIWAAMDVLRKQGHRKVIGTGNITIEPNVNEGIESYYWVHNIDELRTAFTLTRPVVFGLNWYSEFSVPKLVNNEYWIGTKNWGSKVGGHAILGFAISDQREAVRLRNSWGVQWADSWLSYKSLETLFGQNGECAVAIDRRVEQPNPPPSKLMITKIVVEDDGVFYEGENLELEKVS